MSTSEETLDAGTTSRGDLGLLGLNRAVSFLSQGFLEGENLKKNEGNKNTGITLCSQNHES